MRINDDMSYQADYYPNEHEDTQWSDYCDFMERDRRRVNRRIEWSLSILPTDIKEYLLEDVEDSSIHTFTITKLPPSESHIDTPGEYARYVDQHCGVCEDDYHGTIWYRISQRHFIKLEYSC